MAGIFGPLLYDMFSRLVIFRSWPWLGNRYACLNLPGWIALTELMRKADGESATDLVTTPKETAMKQLSKLFGVLLAGAIVVLGVCSGPANAYLLNGFELGDASVPEADIKHGGPPRDGIPALDNPQFVTADAAKNLEPASRVMGVVHKGIAKAYPILIMNWHEIVNDKFGEDPILVTFCPLCGTGISFEAMVNGKPSMFGVSGLLYNSDVLLYDKQTESLWSQVLGTAIAGPQKSASLKRIPTSHTSWADWLARHPDTLVLSEETGHDRNYQRDPYRGYGDSKTVMFQVRHSSEKYHPKELVLALALNGDVKAWPFSELRKSGKQELVDTLGGQSITIEFDDANNTARVLNQQGEQLPAIIAFWFAWYAFHPETAIFKPETQ